MGAGLGGEAGEDQPYGLYRLDDTNKPLCWGGGWVTRLGQYYDDILGTTVAWDT